MSPKAACEGHHLNHSSPRMIFHTRNGADEWSDRDDKSEVSDNDQEQDDRYYSLGGTEDEHLEDLVSAYSDTDSSFGEQDEEEKDEDEHDEEEQDIDDGTGDDSEEDQLEPEDELVETLELTEDEEESDSLSFSEEEYRSAQEVVSEWEHPGGFDLEDEDETVSHL